MPGSEMLLSNRNMGRKKVASPGTCQLQKKIQQTEVQKHGFNNSILKHQLILC
jgi:hypothetical protein